jgi:hypothetical protein
MRSRAPHGLQILDVVTLEIGIEPADPFRGTHSLRPIGGECVIFYLEIGIGDQYEVDSGADPGDNDNDNDAALILSVHEIDDHSCSRHATQGVDHQGLTRTAPQTEEDLEREDTSDEQLSRH